VFYLIIAILFIGSYFYMLQERIASKIRKSPYWFFYWILSLIIISVGASALVKFLY